LKGEWHSRGTVHKRGGSQLDLREEKKILIKKRKEKQTKKATLASGYGEWGA